MADEKVLEAQRWVNSTYGAVSGYTTCPETGNTGWATMYSLTRALQHELGITALSDSFGPTTLAKLGEKGDIGPDYGNGNIIKILQYGLFCKGYWGGSRIGSYDTDTEIAVADLAANAGIFSNGWVQPKLFKAILTMDAYVLTQGGSERIREIQQWLNGRYVGKSTYFIGPCDGHYSRAVQQALMKAIQYELGLPEDQVTGSFGPATRQGLRDHRLRSGDSGVFVELFSAACVFNGQVGGHTASFTSTFDSGLTAYVKKFQEFSLLENHGDGDFATWAQLLVSTGDPDRTVHACDTRYPISLDRARALKNAGYGVVGRYLDEEESSKLDKEIQPGELDAIFAGGLRVFPIWQYNSRNLSNFTYQQGYQHAVRAHARAVGYGFARGVVIYFAVDYDATDAEISSNIVPYFHGVQAGLVSQGKRYIAGVYGSRNVCIRVSDEAYTACSFVSGMSSGYSGNLGFPLPSNWAFNQIQEIKFSNGADTFDLDRDAHRPAVDPGVGADGVNGEVATVEAFLDHVDALYATAVRYNGGDPNLRVLEYLRHPRYTTGVNRYGWEILIGDPDYEWIAYAEANGPARIPTYKDPAYGITINADHLSATASGVYLKGPGSGTTAGLGDFAGWGGDLCTFYADWRNADAAYPSGYAFCSDRLAKVNAATSFSLEDLVDDVDGYFIGQALRQGARIDEAFRGYLSGDAPVRRFRRFFAERYGNSVADTVATARSMLVDEGEWSALRLAAIRVTAWDAVMPAWLPDEKLDPFLQGYADTIQALAGPGDG
ncbi:glycoside hydrolase domain-containing protein [Streptomyces sp. S465]|uniref:glycoside hydrolase domain-containing protein n=1 Tax=Streptomyces sp. S465 TaxID=2979468 RepID=UPI0022A89458|nr:glycoside hydrolase domain-containing protein [Streptomyces sp. S465]WAP53688.1 DUF1906 domain-containing protein [Streptomyces sp. S465]